jgi:hypothetical protein
MEKYRDWNGIGRIVCRLFALLFLVSFTAVAEEAVPPPPPAQGTMPFSGEPDTYQRPEKRIFPLWSEKAKARGRELPPPFGVMVLTNWMNSDWDFERALVSLGGSNPISLDAAQDATMNLETQTTGIKADLWVLPFLDLMVGFGDVNVDADLGLRNIPVDFDPGRGFTRADAIIPMHFNGTYYSFGTVLAGAYRRLYGAVDASWVKTELESQVNLSSSGFWTFTAAPKIGYNAGLSQIYIGARYISKNEHYSGTVPLASGNDLGFDVKVKTDSWVANGGIRAVIREHWEVLSEIAMGKRYQITAGVGYRW